MAASHDVRFVTLGWQAWAFVAVVLTLVLLAAAFVLFGLSS
jgi:hypothetical protein